MGASLTLRSDRVYITSWTYRDLRGGAIHATFSDAVFGKYTQTGNALEFTEVGVPTAETSYGTFSNQAFLATRWGSSDLRPFAALP